MRVEKGGKLALVGGFLVVLGILQEYLTGNFLITMSIACPGMWIWLWALKTGRCFPIFAKFPRWYIYHTTLVLVVLSSVVFIVSLIGVFFFRWELG